jgi:hypothetical protein
MCVRLTSSSTVKTNLETHMRSKPSIKKVIAASAIAMKTSLRILLKIESGTGMFLPIGPVARYLKKAKTSMLNPDGKWYST